jgi:O-antigen/teichoic acid export membrane protein
MEMSTTFTRPSSHSAGFLSNVAWSWCGVLFSLISGLFLAPYVIHHLGDERYGIWILVFSLMDYYNVVDFGFRSAVIKFASHYRVTGEAERLEALVSTGLVYFSIAAVAVLAASLVIARNVTRWFHVLPRDEAAFRFLVITVGVGFALGIVSSPFTGVLEAYQRFDITSRIGILGTGLRVLGCLAVIKAGFGLRAMGVCLLAAQLTTYALYYVSFRRLLPERTFGPRKAHFSTLRQMLSYGTSTFVSNNSLIVLNQSAPVVIGHFLSATQVAYFSFPLRLLNYSVDLVSRMGVVTVSKTAELTALGDQKTIGRMGIVLNRYCLMLFLPLPVFLAIFGRQLLTVWLSPKFAAASAPLLPAMGAGIVIAIAAQYNSNAILFGLAKHASLARAVFVEAVLCLGGLLYVVPHYGVLGAAYLTAVLMALSRGLFVPYALSRHLGVSYGRYLWGIYGRALAIITPVAIAFWTINRALGEPSTWTVVLGCAAAMSACYYSFILWLGILPEHRSRILAGLKARAFGLWPSASGN